MSEYINLPEYTHPNDESNFFINLLVKKNICNFEDIQEFTKNDKLSSKEIIQSIIDHLLSKEIVKPEDIFPFSQEVELFKNRFGKLCIEQKIASQKDIDLALRQQEIIAIQKKSKIEIGRILTHFKTIKEMDVTNILRLQRERFLALQTFNNPSIQRSSNETTANKNKLKDRVVDYEKDQIVIEMYSDKMMAKIVKFNDNKKRNTEQLKAEIKELGIVFGIVADEEIEAFLKKPVFPFVIAKGLEPQKSVDARIKNKCEFLPVKRLERNLILKKDPNNKNFQVPTVEKNAILQIKKMMEPGSPGINIFGEQVIPPPPRDENLKIQKTKAHQASVTLNQYQDEKTGRNFELVQSIFGGIPCINEDKEVFVKNFATIENDIILDNREVLFNGKVDFNLKINGTVKNVEIIGQELEINRNIENSTITAETLKTLNNIENSKLTLNGNLEAFNINANSVIKTKGDINVKNILASNLHCNFLVADSINNSIIKTNNGLRIKEISCNKNSNAHIRVDTSLIKQMNEIVNTTVLYQGQFNRINSLNTTIKQKEKMLEQLKNNNNLEETKSLEIELVKITEYLSNLLEKIREIPVLKNIFTKKLTNDEIIEEMSKFSKENELKLSLLEDQFLQSRKNPVIKISKVLSEVLVKTEGKDFKLEKSNNVMLYENLLVDENGLFTTELNEKRVAYKKILKNENNL